MNDPALVAPWIAKLRAECEKRGRTDWTGLPERQYDQYTGTRASSVGGGFLSCLSDDALRWFLLLVCEAEASK